MDDKKRGPESVGYRANRFGAVKIKRAPNALDKPLTAGDGIVTVYAERRNEVASYGLYGGDAYPIVRETISPTNSRCRYGFILAADGVGKGAFTHPLLERYLKEQTEDYPAEERDRAMLSVFLRTLYGSAIFDARNEEVLDYALRSFSNVPADGFFVSQQDIWEKPDAQAYLPFYKRDSQSLGSRIVCVGLYMKFRHYMRSNDLSGWNEQTAAVLREKIEKYLKEELWARISVFFTHTDPETGKVIEFDRDAPTTDLKNRYFLPSTVAMWLYGYDIKAGTVSALALNMGDARCYVADLVDGVRQISVDDALPDGSMSALVHFGKKHLTEDGFHDGKLRARIVELQAPCALLACSDGVYDTCPGISLEPHHYGFGYGSTECSDFCFEKSLLEAMRRCHSFEDFKREIVFTFYAQSCVGGATEFRHGGNITGVKEDDSGTLAARFFGDKPVEFFKHIRETKDTTLDRLYDELAARWRDYQISVGHESGEPTYGTVEKPQTIPFAPIHAATNEDELRGKWQKLAIGAFKSAMLSSLKEKLYPAAYKSMTEAGLTTLWGIEHTSPTQLTGFLLLQFLNNNNMVNVLNCAVADWDALQPDEEGNVEIPADWLAHEHVIMSADIRKLLNNIDFGGKIGEIRNAKKDEGAEMMFKLYDWFALRFFGEEKPREQVWGPEDGKRLPVDPEELTAILCEGQKKQEEPSEAPAAPAEEAPVVIAEPVEEELVVLVEEPAEEVPVVPAADTDEEAPAIEAEKKDEPADGEE